MLTALEKDFARMGARATVGPWTGLSTAVRPRYRRLAIDVRTDEAGPFYRICLDPMLVRLEVVDLQARDRHLLLAARYLDRGDSAGVLCGYEADGWYVAALSAEEVSSVDGALAVLRG